MPLQNIWLPTNNWLQSYVRREERTAAPVPLAARTAPAGAARTGAAGGQHARRRRGLALPPRQGTAAAPATGPARTLWLMHDHSSTHSRLGTIQTPRNRRRNGDRCLGLLDVACFLRLLCTKEQTAQVRSLALHISAVQSSRRHTPLPFVTLLHRVRLGLQPILICCCPSRASRVTTIQA